MLDNLAPYAGAFVLVVLAVYVLVRVASAAFFKSRNQFNQQKKG